MSLPVRYSFQDDSLNLKESYEVCLKCGLCCVVKEHSCPVQFDDRFTDKNTFVYDCLGSSEAEKNPNIWLCVSCHKCEEMCPYDVSPLRFIKSLKAQAFEFGFTPDMIRGELENILLTGYAFPIMPSTARWRKELGLQELNTSASRDIKTIAEITNFIKKMEKRKESKS